MSLTYFEMYLLDVVDVLVHWPLQDTGLFDQDFTATQAQQLLL